MKIADFFISLGFEVKGKEDLENVDKGMAKAEFSGLKLLAGVTALNAAFYAMITKAVEAGTNLQRFALTTGLSAQELQKWQLTAVRGNIAAESMATAIGAIQKARASIAFGDSAAAAPWMLLGIDPRQDPFKVLQQLQAQIMKLDPAIARQKLSEMGFGDDIFYLMRQNRFGPGNLNKNLIVSPEEVNNLAHLGGAWKEFLFTLGQVSTRFFSTFAEPLAAVLENLTKILAAGGKFVNWLESGTAGARKAMYALMGLLVGITGLGIALGLLALGPAGAIIGVIGVMIASVTTITLLIDDFWTACAGGKSAFDWGDENLLLTVKNVNALAQAIEFFIFVWDEAVAKIKTGKDLFSFGGDILRAAGGDSSGLIGRFAADQVGPTTNAQQTNNLHMHIQASQEAHQMGRDVGRIVTRHISDAFGQMPLQSL